MNTNLPPLSQVINQYGLLGNKGLSKSLGQNFLLDPGITRRIVAVALPLEGFDVIEVGPGPGGLTRSILDANPDHLFAIERDSQCISALQGLIDLHGDRLTIINSDAKKVKAQKLSTNPIKIIANLPYNVGTMLLLQWLSDLGQIQSMTLMFQREVALRITAMPGTSDYGRLSILCQYLCTVHRVFDLPPQAFIPAPKVHSSVVHFVPKVLSADERTLLPFIEKITAAVFTQRRKMLRGSLRGVFSEDILMDVLEGCCIAPTERPENLTISQFCQLAAALLNASSQLGQQET
ncbi:MAG: 16S rRNA (adenine(1518)-N(6)/adenine(1519)-N(6))-dimethyltransferase RsmA [Alphaproteobacteria bacterium]|nr:16S rRNA (adenine(1518)-N(6)/adenine(1519)-N(6))-dimethyltransferase RsmA [Alphaproteobacteria bacterium]